MVVETSLCPITSWTVTDVSTRLQKLRGETCAAGYENARV